MYSAPLSHEAELRWHVDTVATALWYILYQTIINIAPIERHTMYQFSEMHRGKLYTGYVEFSIQKRKSEVVQRTSRLHGVLWELKMQMLTETQLFFVPRCTFSFSIYYKIVLLLTRCKICHDTALSFHSNLTGKLFDGNVMLMVALHLGKMNIHLLDWSLPQQL